MAGKKTIRYRDAGIDIEEADRAGHFFVTSKNGGIVDALHPAQAGRAFQELG